MTTPSKTLPSNYIHRGSVNIMNKSDVFFMLLWSVVLFLLPIPLIYLVVKSRGGSPVVMSSGSLMDFLGILAGIAVVTVAMIVIHEGLHGLVFWMTTHERPRFAFKWYYASACAEGWYIPRIPFLVATLIPLFAITAAGLLILPVVDNPMKYFVALLIVFNSSGCAGDALVAWRLLRLPKETLTLDRGDDVNFFAPA